MTANQNHGFVFEDSVIMNVTGFSKDDYQKLLPHGYVASLDIFKGIHSDDNYSIKVMARGGSIGCGDILRFYKHCANDDFFLVVGVWKQISPTHKRYDEIYEFSLRPSDLSKIWGTISLRDLEEFVSYVKSIEPGKTAQMANRRIWKEKRNRILDSSTGHVIKIDAKIDSQTQRRVQCSINFQKLTELGIEYKIYNSHYRGIDLPYEQESSPRSRKKSRSILHKS